MLRVPDGQLVADAEKKSNEMVQHYLMNDAANVYSPHPSLIPMTKRKKHKKKKDKKRKSRKGRKDGNKSDTSTASDSCEEIEREAGSPVTLILNELRKVTPVGKSPRTFCSIQMYDTFEEWTPEQKKAYDKDAIAAIRSRDIATLRKWKEEGRVLQAANAYGESLLHMACRRDFLDVVTFLVEEAGHNLWIRDDTGRTPLHDACWTAYPSPELVSFILDKEPDLLLVSDKRGHTPLDYARKDHWQTWLDHFEDIDFTQLVPRRDCFYVNVASPVMSDATAVVDNLGAMFGEIQLDDDDDEQASQTPPEGAPTDDDVSEA